MGWLEGWKYRKQISFGRTSSATVEEKYDIWSWSTFIDLSIYVEQLGVSPTDVIFTEMDGVSVITVIQLYGTNKIASDNVMSIYGLDTSNPLLGDSATKNIFMYFGKLSGAVEQPALCSSGDFDVCDSFNDNSIDTSIWDTQGDVSEVTEEAGSETTGHLKINSEKGLEDPPYIKSKTTFGPGCTLTMRVLAGSYAGTTRKTVFGISNSDTPWTSGEGAYLSYTNGFKLQHRIEGEIEEYSLSGSGLIPEAWFTLKIHISAEGYSYFTVDGEQVWSCETIQITAENLKVFAGSDNTIYYTDYDDRVDWVSLVAEDPGMGETEELEVDVVEGVYEIDRRGEPMRAAKDDIVIEEGSKFSYPIVWRDANGNPHDLSSAAATCEILSSPLATTAIATIATGMPGDETGAITLTKLPSSTKDMTFERGWLVLEVSESGGTPGSADDSVRLLEGPVTLSRGGSQ